MGRERYERQSDRRNEARVADHFAVKCSVAARKFPDGPRYSIDYGFFEIGGARRMVGVGEVKCRGKRYDTLIIGLSKIRELCAYHRMGFGAVIIVEWPDGIYWCKVGEKTMRDARTEWGGRVDRMDADDMEPVVHLPSEWFRRI